ncbi:hypothetical protein ATO6_09965 [Oceanicola sp. 22II-s10i]|uniref:DUF6456 domain-containing protein n=1 Tax=Oceanicola sp. 22II-s10i TaxID=1317116 RepID=UPI000B52341C|nr:DUF6456 domain-containing protein [Oceanicola sp. 22II-s10i]OWU85332.1 hypothetical protein ATO6_09965 [Oceanicola sp. 22II-s10i]
MLVTPHAAVTGLNARTLPSWVPDAARRYLAHTEQGQSIRALARAAGCHASTVMRQIRRIENARDDVLVDEALRRLGRFVRRQAEGGLEEECNEMTTQEPLGLGAFPDAATLRREARRILRRLCEPGAVLAVAAEMEKAVAVRDTASGTTERLAVVERATAEALALKGWIACDAPGRVSRYTITAEGRAELNRLLVLRDGGEAVRRGMAEAATVFDTADRTGGEAEEEAEVRRRIRYGTTETPVAMLARRRDGDGRPFLDDSLVRAAVRLAEDFELAQIGTRVTQDWDRFLTAGTAGGIGDGAGGSGSGRALARVQAALADLGPGLGDMALRCCCYQQGLETAERRMGWSARSGKIVLRIALQRLRLHYDRLGDAGGMIG